MTGISRIVYVKVSILDLCAMYKRHEVQASLHVLYTHVFRSYIGRSRIFGRIHVRFDIYVCVYITEESFCGYICDLNVL